MKMDKYSYFTKIFKYAKRQSGDGNKKSIQSPIRKARKNVAGRG